jgi:ferredoxin
MDNAMRTTIYYFTGTGNSLAVAKKMAAAYGDCELVPIASLTDTPGDIVPAAERIGIVCPVYFSGLPVMVAVFAGRLDCTAVKYVFAVVTNGGGGGSAALRQLDCILRKRQGRGLDAGFGVAMPGNYILMYSSPVGKQQEEILAKADGEIAGITGPVIRCERRELPSSLVPRVLYTLLYPWFTSHVHTDDRKFSVNDKCTACGICVAICPAKNIELVNKKPVWQHHCELCCGCIHNCPVQAIQAGAKTEKWLRYRNPSVTVAELKGKQEEKA